MKRSGVLLIVLGLGACDSGDPSGEDAELRRCKRNCKDLGDVSVLDTTPPDLATPTTPPDLATPTAPPDLATPTAPPDLSAPTGEPTTPSTADRHVYLDVNGDGVLNDCPNPRHNVKGSSNRDEIAFCRSGSQNGKVIGTVTGTTTAATCADGGGTIGPLRSGAQVDIDRDGLLEVVYGQPQAAVWNMKTSDSVEVHAGTYTRPGAFCGANCGLAGANNQMDTTDSFQAVVMATGFGPNLYNPANPSASRGYGTAQAPGYLRGAVMNGSTDTWDADGNLQDDGNPNLAVVFSGDANNNGVIDNTTCTGTGCTGDSFFGLTWGCLGGTHYSTQGWCLPAPTSATTFGGVQIDGDGDPTNGYEASASYVAASQPLPPIHHLRIKDIKFTRFNGGNGSLVSVGSMHAGIIEMSGNGASNGGWLEHIEATQNAGTAPGSDGVSFPRETAWAVVSDNRNRGCAEGPSRLFNSFLEMNNQVLFDSDGVSTCGCSSIIHDNLIRIDPATTGELRIPSGVSATKVFYIKNVELLPNQGNIDQQIRIYNNRIFLEQTYQTFFLDLQAHGFNNGDCANPDYKGQVWIHGNLVWGPGKLARMWSYADHRNPSCPSAPTDRNGGDHGSAFIFANTFDLGSAGVTEAANSPMATTETYRYSNRDNVYVGVRNLDGGYDYPSASIRYQKSIRGRIGFNAIWNEALGGYGQMDHVYYRDLSDSSTQDAGYWICNDEELVGPLVASRTVGLCAGVLGGGDADDSVCPGGVNNCNGFDLALDHTNARLQVLANMFSTGTSYPGLYGTAAFSYFAARVGGPLDGGGSCDPDGDGVAGVDWNGDGINDTTWTDIAGNTVSCSSPTTTIDVGAIQSR